MRVGRWEGETRGSLASQRLPSKGIVRAGCEYSRRAHGDINERTGRKERKGMETERGGGEDVTLRQSHPKHGRHRSQGSELGKPAGPEASEGKDCTNRH